MTTIKNEGGSQLVFPEFNDIKVSTKTFIVKTNLVLDLPKLFDFLPITDYVVIPKKRGRKKKISQANPNKDILDGSIVTMKYENRIKGVDLKQKKSHKKKKPKWFRNSFTVVIILNDKPINFKICQNGMLQVTGCKLDSQAESCIKVIWGHIKDQENNIYTFSHGSHLETIFIPAMRNIDFDIGFLVDREKLAKYMSTQTQFYSLLETSFGYTGVNVKIPITDNIANLKIKKFDFIGKKVIESFITYNDYLNLLPEKEKQKKLAKKRYCTFLIFHSGRVILSSLNADYAREAYNYFLKIIKTCYDEIEERLDK